MTIPNGLDELRAQYGALQIDTYPRGGYRIIQPSGWESANMVVISALPGLPPERRLYVNKALETPLRTALLNALAVCPDYVVKTIGCFNPRYKRTVRGDLSVHSWGLAVDINAATNPLAAELTTDMPDAFVQAFKDQGFVWGGDWNHLKDAMHYQLVSGY